MLVIYYIIPLEIINSVVHGLVFLFAREIIVSENAVRKSVLEKMSREKLLREKMLSEKVS